MTIEEFLVPIDSRADAERADAMEALLRGELSKEDFETLNNIRKMTNKDSMTRHETAVRTAKMKGGIWAHPLTVDTMLGIFSSPLPP